MKRDTIVLCSLLLITTLHINAQSQEREDLDKRVQKTALLDLQEHYKEWAKETVFPQLAEWKGALDNSMMSNDLAALNHLRTEAKALPRKLREHRLGLRNAWKTEDEKALAEHRTRLTEIQKQWLDIINELESLAFTYRDVLQELIQTSRPVIKGWKKEGREILLQWKEEQKKEVQISLYKFMQNHDLPRRWFNSNLSKRKKIARFMLWDGEMMINDTNPNGNTIENELPDLH